MYALQDTAFRRLLEAQAPAGELLPRLEDLDGDAERSGAQGVAPR
jgi:hypothetical protein